MLRYRTNDLSRAAGRVAVAWIAWATLIVDAGAGEDVETAPSAMAAPDAPKAAGNADAPWLFEVVDPASKRRFYLQGEPDAPFGDADFTPHPALVAALEQAPRLFMTDRAFDALRAAEEAEASRVPLWTPEERADWEAWIPRVRKVRGVYLAGHKGAGILVRTDVSARFAAETLAHAKRQRELHHAVLPRVAAAPNVRRRVFRPGAPAWLEYGGPILWHAASGYPVAPGYDTVVSVWKDRSRYGHLFIDFTDALGYCDRLERTAYTEMALHDDVDDKDADALSWADLPDTLKTLRHELGHAFLRNGPDPWRQNSFIQEGWAEFFETLDPRAADPRAEAARAAADFDLASVAERLSRLPDGPREWPSPRLSFETAPLAWWFPERDASGALTYGAGGAFVAFMIDDPARWARFDEAVARVNVDGGALFGEDELIALEKPYGAWLRARFPDATHFADAAAAEADGDADVWLARIPPALRLPDGTRLTDVLDPDARWAWRAARSFLALPAPVQTALEHGRPLLAVAYAEMGLTVNWNGSEPGTLSVGARLLRRARAAGTPVERWNLPVRPADVIETAARHAARFDADWERAAFGRMVALLQGKDTDGVGDWLFPEREAFAANDRVYLALDPDWNGFLRTRGRSEWRRAVDIPRLADRIAAALKEGGAANGPAEADGPDGELVVGLGVVPMHDLADSPDGNLLDALNAQGFETRPIEGR